MGNRATAAWVAFALVSVALPPGAAAQDTSAVDPLAPLQTAGEMADAAGWSLRAATQPSESASEAKPPERADQIELAEASRPRMPSDETADAAAPTSEAIAQMARWVTASGDNGELPFIIIDKVAADVSVFDAEGQFVGTTPALLGVTAGDDSAPGVGDRELSEIPPEDRTTPAGRFVAKFGPASGNRNVLWVDYATSISLHAVVTGNKKERRLQRLKSPSVDDNRITYGCINIPTRFYGQVVRPLFKGSSGVVYILPEIKPLNEVFPTFQLQGQSAAQAWLGR